MAALGAAVVLGACGTRPTARPGAHPASATPVTAVPATTPPPTKWDAVPAKGPGTRLGPWRLQNRFLALAALGDQGLASLTRPGQRPALVFRGSVSISSALRRAGFDHVGDPDAWHGYLVDAYQASGTTKKMFAVTTPDGIVHYFFHHLARGEQPNNSFVAVAPNGRWMVSGEWGTVHQLLVFPTPIVNPAVPADRSSLALAARISLNRPVRDVQGCVFTSATRLLCASDDPGTDLWPTPDQLLQVSLPRGLDGHSVTARVASLGELPIQSDCVGNVEVEGIDFQASSGVLRVEVLPPGRCGLAVTVYDYRK